jgi:DNA-directed RNA polymerase specialized sigma24 family protein
MADFCQVFTDDMTSLYMLAYLLTLNGQKAEQCFVSGLDDSNKGNPVFKEWAHSWARRTIIQNAIQLVQPQPSPERASSDITFKDQVSANRERPFWGERTELLAILELPAFERFVFVMSVLQRYSDGACASLLGCTPRDVVAARTRASRTFGNMSGAPPQTAQANAGS